MITHSPQPQRKFWHDALDEAEQRLREGTPPLEAFTYEQKWRASSWPTCACGTGDPRIPKTPLGIPMDHALLKLGLRFSFWVSTGDVDEAKSTMNKIDFREAEILSEMEQRGEL